MGIAIVNKRGSVVRKSMNLRGLITHMGLNEVRKVCIRENARGTGTLLVLFTNGDSCITLFASFTVLQNWVRERRALKDTPINTETYCNGKPQQR